MAKKIDFEITYKGSKYIVPSGDFQREVMFLDETGDSDEIENVAKGVEFGLVKKVEGEKPKELTREECTGGMNPYWECIAYLLKKGELKEYKQ